MSTERTLTPYELFRAARLTDCLSALDGDDRDDAHILRARIFLQLDRTEEVLRELSWVRALHGDVAATAAALKYRALNRLGRSDAVAWLSMPSSSYGNISEIGRAEVALARSVIRMYRIGPNHPSVETADQVECELGGPWYSAWYRYTRAFLPAIHGRWVDGVAGFEALANYVLETPGAADVLLLARAAQPLAAICREMFSKQRFDFVIQLFERIQWTDDLSESRFHVKRCIAWGHALQGNERLAHHLIFQLIDELPGPGWRPILYADQARFMFSSGGTAVAEPLLDRAIEFAQSATWSADEERVGLLNLIVLAAEYRAPAARGLLEVYENIRIPIDSRRTYMYDGRLRAMEDHARGSVLAAEGDRRAAQALLTDVFTGFLTLGYTWRAASVALELHTLTGSQVWLRRAEDAAAAFPQSAIAREIRRRRSPSADPRLAALSPAQRRVFKLVCQGKSNKEIAATLDISVNTARNHVAAILSRFGAHSRGHLVALARDAEVRP